ncbi:MAG: Clp protease ClpP, partial [Selenomonas sp.]|nr:Clp protease ClpP [Selenomonas sp.]
ADSILYADVQRPVTEVADGLIFSRAAVTNSLLSKFGQGIQANNVDAEPFKKRLFSISH